MFSGLSPEVSLFRKSSQFHSFSLLPFLSDSRVSVFSTRDSEPGWTEVCDPDWPSWRGKLVFPWLPIHWGFNLKCFLPKFKCLHLVFISKPGDLAVSVTFLTCQQMMGVGLTHPGSEEWKERHLVVGGGHPFGTGTPCKKSSQGTIEPVNSQMGGLPVGNPFFKFLPVLHSVQVYVSLRVHLEAIFHRSWAEAMNVGDRKGPRTAVVRPFGD